eukprot:c10311_g1_i1 orf=208-684(+)
MADPLLQGQYPMRGLYQALAVAAMCLQEQASTRPLIGDVVTALTYLASQTYDPSVHLLQSTRFGPPTPGREKKERERKAVDEQASPRTFRQGSFKSHRHDSPDAYHQEGGSRAFNGAAEDTGSGRKSHVDSDGGQRESPGSGGRTPRRFHRAASSLHD